MTRKFDVIYWDDDKSKVVIESFDIKQDAECFIEEEFTFHSNKTFIKMDEVFA